MGLFSFLRKSPKDVPLPPFYLQSSSEARRPCGLPELLAGLQALRTDPDEFLILEPAEPVRDVRFLQAAGVDGGIDVELSIRRGGDWALLGQVYTDDQTVRQIFLDFFQKGQLPPLKGFTPVF